MRTPRPRNFGPPTPLPPRGAVPCSTLGWGWRVPSVRDIAVSPANPSSIPSPGPAPRAPLPEQPLGCGDVAGGSGWDQPGQLRFPCPAAGSMINAADRLIREIKQKGCWLFPALWGLEPWGSPGGRRDGCRVSFEAVLWDRDEIIWLECVFAAQKKPWPCWLGELGQGTALARQEEQSWGRPWDAKWGPSCAAPALLCLVWGRCPHFSLPWEVGALLGCAGLIKPPSCICVINLLELCCSLDLLPCSGHSAVPAWPQPREAQGPHGGATSAVG